MNHNYLIRDYNSPQLLQNFLTSSIATIVIIRIYLTLTGFPQIGGETLHIAHMLWGGLLMLIALICLLGFLNHRIKFLASFIGGVGFGTFIDELGKFITNDNDYFFQPTFAILYILFVLLFFLFQSLERRIKPTPQEHLVNALELTKELITSELDEEEKHQILHHLKQAGINKPIAVTLHQLITQIQAQPIPPDNTFNQIKNYLRTLYKRIIQYPKFNQSVITLFAIFSIIGLLKDLYNTTNSSSIMEWGLIIANLISSTQVLIGIYYIRQRDRLRAYQYFKKAILTSIFLSQFFQFYFEQLAAIIGLAIDLLILQILEYLIAQETIDTHPIQTR